LGKIEVQLNISVTQDPTVLGVWIQLKTDVSNVLPKVVHAPSHPRNEAPAVLSLDLEGLISAQVTVEQQAASIDGNILSSHLIGKRRSVLVASSHG
jgi:hypothetical protein